MKIIDCFLFLNEFDLLEFRLKWMSPYVDRFVIAESNITHSGKAKPYHFPEQAERFQPWMHKITYLPVQQSIEGRMFEKQTAYNPNSAAFRMEYEMRNHLVNGVAEMDEDDLVLLGDLDEIPDPAAIIKAKKAAKPIAFSLLFHYYFFNGQQTGSGRWWRGCIASTVKQFRETTPQGLRDQRDKLPALPHAGWHFSYLGGIEMIRQKIRSYAHTEFDTTEYNDEAHLRRAILNGRDIFNREGMQVNYTPLSYYPAALQRLMKQYPAFINPPERNTLKDGYYWLRRCLKGNV